MQDQFDITLEDLELLAEVELTTDLIIAATESNRPLSAAEIDRLLGVAQPVGHHRRMPASGQRPRTD